MPSKAFAIFSAGRQKTYYSENGACFRLVFSKSLCSDVLRTMHDDATSGHFGFVRALHCTQERLYWPHMYQTTKQYVASYGTCQRHKRPTSAVRPPSPGPIHRAPFTGLPSPGPLRPLTPPSMAFEQVGIDLLGPFFLLNNQYFRTFVSMDHLALYADRCHSHFFSCLHGGLLAPFHSPSPWPAACYQ